MTTVLPEAIANNRNTTNAKIAPIPLFVLFICLHLVTLFKGKSMLKHLYKCYGLDLPILIHIFTLIVSKQVSSWKVQRISQPKWLFHINSGFWNSNIQHKGLGNTK